MPFQASLYLCLLTAYPRNGHLKENVRRNRQLQKWTSKPVHLSTFLVHSWRTDNDKETTV
jgi:hypothetical protein